MYSIPADEFSNDSARKPAASRKILSCNARLPKRFVISRGPEQCSIVSRDVPLRIQYTVLTAALAGLAYYVVVSDVIPSATRLKYITVCFGIPYLLYAGGCVFTNRQLQCDATRNQITLRLR